MPGPYIHIAVSDRIRARLRDIEGWSASPSMDSLPVLGGPSPKEIADFAQRHPNYFALGAIGPDLFFFLPDFRAACIAGKRLPIANSLIGILEWLDRLYTALDEWILKDWERIFGPVSENIEEALSALTGDLSTVVSDIVGKLSSIAITALLDLASQAYDWFGLFSLGLNKGYDNQDFFWSDMLHYRKTSQFGRSLWELALAREASGQPTPDAAKAEADKLRAYALGYMTHLAADTTGHPFVNEKCGGPFRTHWQRHHLVENHMDAQTYDDDALSHPKKNRDGDAIYTMLTESALHYRIVFKDSGDDETRLPPDYKPGDKSLHALYVRRRQLDIDSKMPGALAEFLFDAMGRTYNTGAAPTLGGAADSSPRIIMGGDGRPAPGAIQTAYDLLFHYLKFSMLDGFNHEKPTPPDLFPNLHHWQLTDPFDGPPTEFDADMSFWDLCLAILVLIVWLAVLAAWLAIILPVLLLDLATFLPRLIAYYAIQLPLYYMLKAARRIMVMTGFLHPTRDEIDFGLVRLCLGHNDSFLAMLKDMNDSLGGIEDDVLAAIAKQAVKLVEILAISAADAMAQVLGEHDQGSTTSEPNPDANYPHSQPLDGNKDAVEYHAPWQYPSSRMEVSHTFAGPYACGSMPRILLDATIPGNQTIRSQYENAKLPSDTDRISLGVDNTHNLGDPVNFSAYLIWQLTRAQRPDNDLTHITDWNLDADRGYAYKCWDWDRHQQAGASLEHVLQDMEGHQYMEPCTAPPQSENPKASHPCAPPPKTGHDPDKPLKIHYTGQPDPGCVSPVLVFSILSRDGGRVSMNLANTGEGAAANVKILSVKNVIPNSVVHSTEFGAPPYIVPGGLLVGPGANTSFNLQFLTQTGSSMVVGAFNFKMTVAADNLPQFDLTINVP